MIHIYWHIGVKQENIKWKSMMIQYCHLRISWEAVVDMAAWVAHACDWTEWWIFNICQPPSFSLLIPSNDSDLCLCLTVDHHHHQCCWYHLNPIWCGPFGRFWRAGGGTLCPPHLSKSVGGLWFQNWVITSHLTQIDTRQKDLQLSDT